MSTTTENGWAKELPTANGIYWYRINPESSPDVVQVHAGDVYYTAEAGATSVVSHAGGEWLGPVSPSHLEQLAALRSAATGAVKDAEFALSTPGFVRGRDELAKSVAALREALNPELAQGEES